MASAKRYVKYMVSLRCKLIVREEIEKAGLRYTISPHGAIKFLDETSPAQLEELKKSLQKSGLVLLGENDSMLVDRIISSVIELIHYSDQLPDLSFEDIISRNLGTGSESILKIFSDVKGISIMQFIIFQKIEKVKEHLLYDDLSLAEISERLRYKNENLLIAQFKKYTGLSPSYYRKLRDERMNVSR